MRDGVGGWAESAVRVGALLPKPPNGSEELFSPLAVGTVLE